MKASNLILGASLLVNVALLGTIAGGLAVEGGSAAAVKPAPVAAPQPKGPTGPGPETWATLQQGADYTAQRDRLKAEGFPDRMIRAILAAEVRAKYAAQRRALEGNEQPPFWKTPKYDAQQTAALRELSKAERKELRDLLGPDPDNFASENFKRQIPNLSDEKAEELAAIQQRYNDQRQEIYMGGPMTPADQEKLRAMDAAIHNEFAAVLTPQEMEDYDLRASRTASQLQYNLSAFNPTEQEYRSLYKLQAAFDAQYAPSYGPMSQDDMKARMAAQKQLQDDIAATLGPDRYSEYQKDTDFNYRQAAQLVARLDLPAETADQLYAVQKEYQQKQRDVMQSIQTMPSASREEAQQKMQDMQQQLATLQQEATARISTVFRNNADAVDAYKTYGGQWLRNMVPRFSQNASGTRAPVTLIRTGP